MCVKKAQTGSDSRVVGRWEVNTQALVVDGTF